MFKEVSLIVTAVIFIFFYTKEDGIYFVEKHTFQRTQLPLDFFFLLLLLFLNNKQSLLTHTYLERTEKV